MVPALRNLSCRSMPQRTSATAWLGATTLREQKTQRMMTYRLKGLGAMVAILALGALVGTGAARGNVGVVGLLAVGHGC